MNKKLIAAAVVAGLAAPMAAQADVTVYGRASLSIDSVDSGSGTVTTIGDDRGNTRLGVRWSDDLGGGLKGIGEFEFAPVDASSANTPKGQNFYQRQTWAGLKGGFGQVEIGTILQPYKYSGGVAYDAFVGTIAEARGNDGGMLSSHFGQGGYMGNALAYRNKFGSVSFALAYSPAEENDGLYQGSKGDLNASLKFGFSGGEVGVAYAKNKAHTGTTGVEGQKNTKIFGKYSFGPGGTIFAQYETSSANGDSVDGGAAGEDVKVYFLGYRYMIGKTMLAAQLGQTKYDGATEKRKYAALGAVHSFSKKTKAYVAYRKTDQGAAETKGWAIGLIESF